MRLLLAGAVGLVAAVVLMVEKIELIQNPDYIPTCSFNPVLSCGSVMDTPQAAAFGIPNPIFGIAGYAVAAAIGAALLAGATFRRWFWIAAQLLALAAVVFAHWLIYQSLFVIGALCLYCMVVWVVTIVIVWDVTMRCLQPLRRSSHRAVRTIATMATDYRGAILTAWFLVIIGLIAHRFWNYWVTLL